MPQPLIELGGDPSNPALIHIAPANGFVPQTYLPLLRPFMEAYRVVSLPPRALWGDGGPPAASGEGWYQLGEDFLAGITTFGLKNVIVVGHSFGGVASMMAALKQPEHFRALILLDPTILVQQWIDMIKMAWEQGISIPMAERALRRRQEFASVQEAFDLFRDRSFFEQWSDEALWLYAEHGTRPADDGNRRILTWSAEWEAYYFNIGFTPTWELVPQLKNLLPTLIIRGGSSDTFTAESAQRVAELLPAASHTSIPGHGHLFPQTAPQETARIIQGWLTRLD